MLLKTTAINIIVTHIVLFHVYKHVASDVYCKTEVFKLNVPHVFILYKTYVTMITFLMNQICIHKQLFKWDTDSSFACFVLGLHLQMTELCLNTIN